MQNAQTHKLTRATLMFPLALVLFEFSVYICNDLIQPAMLAITRDFGVSSSWAPSSMSFFLLGGAFVAAILGPLSDRLGRKSPARWRGIFVICCLAILLTPNIQSFLFLRFYKVLACPLLLLWVMPRFRKVLKNAMPLKSWHLWPMSPCWHHF